jgi:NitT/TauT family transport system permease protein
VGTAAGLHSADENSRMLFKTIGASRFQTLIKMKLPMGMPQFFTGLKIGTVGVMAGAITGEFLGGGKGFGELIRVASTNLNTARVFALIIFLSLIGLSLYLLVGWIQRKLIFWQKSGLLGDGF